MEVSKAVSACEQDPFLGEIMVIYGHVLTSVLIRKTVSDQDMRWRVIYSGSCAEGVVPWNPEDIAWMILVGNMFGEFA